jgi:hypothetical protein
MSKSGDVSDYSFIADVALAEREAAMGLPCGVVASDEEFEHLEKTLANPEGPTPAIIRGAALLKKIQLERALRRAGMEGRLLPTLDIAGWFVNTSTGPEFWVGTPPQPGMQPLFLTPAYPGQEPCAFKATGYGGLITQDRLAYRDDIKWTPLYLARGPDPGSQA